MNPDRNSQTNASQLEILQQQISSLNRELEEAKIVNQSMWSLLVEITNRLQMSSSAIKASVSSLLDHDIFWDGSTQHELLEIIDDSADQVSNQIILLSLAFRSEANDLTMQVEPYDIQEVFIPTFDKLGRIHPNLELKIDIPSEGKSILVDYKYLSVALELLFDVIAVSQQSLSGLEVQAREHQTNWHMDIFGIDSEIAGFIANISSCEDEELITDIRLLPTNKLKLFVVCNIFSLQNILIESLNQGSGSNGLRLILPQVENTKSNLNNK
jgi:K+-sensing histidine kinase KdpD